MKKISIIITLLLLCFLPAGCGGEKQEEEQTQTPTGYYEILSEREDFPGVSAADNETLTFLGMQYYQGEAVQIWAAVDWSKDREKADIYLYRAEGERECIMQGVPRENATGSTRGFLDREGNLYCFNNLGIAKRASSGKLLYNKMMDSGILINGICQLEDGRIFLAYTGTSGGFPSLGELDAGTGDISSANIWYEGSLSISTAGTDSLLCMDSESIYKVSVDGIGREIVWSNIGTSYVRHGDSSEYDIGSRRLWDFRIGEDGNPELLWGGKKGDGSFVEILKKAEIGADKTCIVIQGSFGTEFKEMVNLFNESNSSYRVVLEECGFYEDSDDYAKRISIEVGTGGGPDIFYGEVLGEYTNGIVRNGGFENLAPYLDKSGIEEDSYFPVTFGYWRNGEEIYSVMPDINFLRWKRGVYYMDASLLGGNREPDIEELADALLSWQEKAVYERGLDSGGVLEMLIMGTEDIWGAVDWETGTCDFGGGLFAKILEVSKKYGDDESKNYPELVDYDYFYVYGYKDSAMLEEEGLAAVGVLFDDGCHAAAASNTTLSINVNSARKEGAWEFIRFLLGDEMQEKIYDMTYKYPVNKAAFDTAMAGILEKEEQKKKEAEENGRTYRSYYDVDPTSERMEELKERIENAKVVPSKTISIQDIIYEEVQDYFNGVKGVDEVIALINNRVQLYLDENR